MKTPVKDEIAGYNMIIEDDVVAYPGDMVASPQMMTCTVEGSICILLYCKRICFNIDFYYEYTYSITTSSSLILTSRYSSTCDA